MNSDTSNPITLPKRVVVYVPPGVVVETAQHPFVKVGEVVILGSNGAVDTITCIPLTDAGLDNFKFEMCTLEEK